MSIEELVERFRGRSRDSECVHRDVELNRRERAEAAGESRAYGLCANELEVELAAVDDTSTDIYGCPSSVTIIRRFADGRELGAGTDDGSFFVYDRHPGERWHKHCGPYSTFDQAADWINAIREGR